MKSKDNLDRSNNDELFRELSDDELDNITAGISWSDFGECILANGGNSIPALAPLVVSIAQSNWIQVAILATSNSAKPIPIVQKCLNKR